MNTLSIMKLVGVLIAVDYIRLSVFYKGNNEQENSRNLDKTEGVNHIHEEPHASKESSFKIKDENGNELKINSESIDQVHSADEIKESVHIKILYCSSCGYKNHVEDLRREFLSTYTNVEVTSDTYPIGSTKEVMCYAVHAIQYLLLFIILFPAQARANLRFIPPQIISFLEEKKWIAAVAVYFVGNSIASGLKSTSAFEVFANGSLLYSKLKNGSIPQFAELIKLIQRNGIVLA